MWAKGHKLIGKKFRQKTSERPQKSRMGGYNSLSGVGMGAIAVTFIHQYLATV